MKEILQHCLHIPSINGLTGIPVLVEGPPGGGKTSIIQQIALAEGLPLETVILSVREPQDVVGVPVLTKDGVKIEPPAWCKRLIEQGKGILFLDELACASPAVQAAALRIVAERVVGEVALPKEVRIIAATNSTEDAAGGWEIAPPLANRFLHLKWNGPKSNEWTDWLLGLSDSYNAVPKTDNNSWQNALSQAKGIICSFLNSRPSLLGPNVPADPLVASRAWPSPRTWEMTTNALAWCKLNGLSYLDYLYGLVGEGAAKEFIAFDFYKDLPDPRDLLMGKVKFNGDKRIDKTLAVLTGVASYAVTFPEFAGNAWALLEAISTNVKARDTMVPAARILIKAKLFHSKEATKALSTLGDLAKNLKVL